MSEKLPKYRCKPCKYVYDPEVGIPEYGIPAGTPFEKLPEDWTCPKCAASRWMFEKVEE